MALQDSAGRDGARELFRLLKLTFEDIGEGDIDVLLIMIQGEFRLYKNETDHARQMNMQIQSPKKKDIKFKKNGLQYAFLKCRGSYFRDRDCVEFNETGLITFASWASDQNVQPILYAFKDWCYWLKARK